MILSVSFAIIAHHKQTERALILHNQIQRETCAPGRIAEERPESPRVLIKCQICMKFPIVRDKQVRRFLNSVPHCSHQTRVPHCVQN
jgi:hypothetical protein